MQQKFVSQAALAVALSFTWTSHAWADEAGKTIIVTGNSLEETLPQELATYGHDIAILDEKRIKDIAPLDMARALELVPGLYIRSQNGPFSYVDIALQGSRTQDVLWTMDGIRLNNRLYGTTSPNDTLPASMIERIEVLKGGESLFYGTQAAAGMINVVTRGFTDDLNGQINGSVDNRASTSVDGYVRGSLGGGHRFVAYASHNQAEGYNPFSVSQPSLTHKKYGYDMWSAGLKYQYELAPDLTLNAQWQHTEAKIDNLAPSRVNKSRNDRNEEIGSVRLDYTADDGVQFFLKGYFHDWKTAYVQILNPIPAGPPITVFPPGTFWGYRDWGGSAVVKLHLHRGLEYLVGYDYQNFNGRDDVLLIAPTSEQVHAGIFQVRTTDEISEKGRIAAGLRYNKGDGTKKTIWNVSGRYTFSDALFVEANGGTAFVFPDASALYGNDPCCETGNPNLKPEESLNLNAAVGGKIGLGAGSLRWKATYFNRRITDLIDYDYDNPAFPGGTYKNVEDKVKSEGAELEVGASWDNGWSALASYTYARVRNSGSSTQRDRNPKQFAKGGLAYAPDDQRFGGNITVSWVGDVFARAPGGFPRRNYGNYALVDAGVFLYVDGEARRNRFAINVENIFDKDYATRGYRSGVTDAGVLDGTSSRFEFYNRGVPRTLRVSYGLTF
ncbi:vitamin B12 transporter [Sphingobium faniae]|nr:vitamin B12 transporter [Sphingobium faniae]